MADKKHVHGSMDISEQEATFQGFANWIVRVVVATVVILILLYMING